MLHSDGLSIYHDVALDKKRFNNNSDPCNLIIEVVCNYYMDFTTSTTTQRNMGDIL